MKKLSICTGLLALGLSFAAGCGGRKGPGPSYKVTTHAVAPR